MTYFYREKPKSAVKIAFHLTKIRKHAKFLELLAPIIKM